MQTIQQQINKLKEACPKGYYVDNLQVALFGGEPQVTCEYKRTFRYGVAEMDWQPNNGKVSLFKWLDERFTSPRLLSDKVTPEYEIVKIWSLQNNKDNEVGYAFYKQYLDP